MSADMHFLAGQLAEAKDGDEWTAAFRYVMGRKAHAFWCFKTGDEFIASLKLADAVLDFLRGNAGQRLPPVNAWAAEREQWAWQRDLLREELKRCMATKPGARKDAIAYVLEQTAERPDSKEQR